MRYDLYIRPLNRLKPPPQIFDETMDYLRMRLIKHAEPLPEALFVNRQMLCPFKMRQMRQTGYKRIVLCFRHITDRPLRP